MTDDADRIANEKKLRSVAAEAYRYVKPEAAQPSSFETFDLTPTEVETADAARSAVRETAKKQFQP